MWCSDLVTAFLLTLILSFLLLSLSHTLSLSLSPSSSTAQLYYSRHTYSLRFSINIVLPQFSTQCLCRSNFYALKAILINLLQIILLIHPLHSTSPYSILFNYFFSLSICARPFPSLHLFPPSCLHPGLISTSLPVIFSSAISPMEAEALYSFRASESDELSFQKGDILKVSLSVYVCACNSSLWTLGWNYQDHSLHAGP